MQLNLQNNKNNPDTKRSKRGRKPKRTGSDYVSANTDELMLANESSDINLSDI